MINTVIREVSLYRRGFTVTSEGVMHLEKGTNSVRIAGLLNGTNEDTVKLFVTGKLSGSNVQVKRLTDEEKKELLRDMERKIAEVDSRITSKTRQSELWLVNADFSNRNNATVEDITGYIEKLPEALEKLDEEIRKLNDEKEVLNKELKKLKQKSEELYVSADVLAEEAGEYPFRISFYSDNAYWNPIYELHTDDLQIKRFERDEDWFRYIFSNRRRMPDALSDFDVIIGPIANDTLYNTFGVLTSGMLDDTEDGT